MVGLAQLTVGVAIATRTVCIVFKVGKSISWAFGDVLIC